MTHFEIQFSMIYVVDVELYNYIFSQFNTIRIIRSLLGSSIQFVISKDRFVIRPAHFSRF